MENTPDPSFQSESEPALYIELDDRVPPSPLSQTPSPPPPLPENLSILDTPLNFAPRSASPPEQGSILQEPPPSAPPPVLVVLGQTPPLKLAALVGALLIIFLLFPQFLLILRGALLELLLLVRALIFPLAALGFAILLLYLFYARSAR